MPRINVNLAPTRINFNDGGDPAVDGLANLAATLANLGPQMQQLRMAEDDRAFQRQGVMQERGRADARFGREQTQWANAEADRADAPQLEAARLGGEVDPASVSDRARPVVEAHGRARGLEAIDGAGKALGGMTMGGVDANGDGTADAVTPGMMSKMNMDVNGDGRGDMMARGRAGAAAAAAAPKPSRMFDQAFQSENLKIMDMARKRSMAMDETAFADDAERAAWIKAEQDSAREHLRAVYPDIQPEAAPGVAPAPTSGGAAPQGGPPVQAQRTFTPEARLGGQRQLAQLKGMDPALLGKRGFTPEIMAGYEQMFAGPQPMPGQAPAAMQMPAPAAPAMVEPVEPTADLNPNVNVNDVLSRMPVMAAPPVAPQAPVSNEPNFATRGLQMLNSINPIDPPENPTFWSHPISTAARGVGDLIYGSPEDGAKRGVSAVVTRDQRRQSVAPKLQELAARPGNANPEAQQRIRALMQRVADGTISDEALSHILGF